MNGVDALPFVDQIEAEEIDLLLVSHFHLDHCGALPWFLLKTTFKGRCFMTHATKAIYRWLLADYIKVSNIGSADSNNLYTEADLEASMDKIEVINFHEQKEVNGIRFWCYHAGHVLGAAMFFIEIAGVKVLYTGDFSRQEDRHLMSAEIPSVKPDVLIIESTYGTHIHEKRAEREHRFTSLVQDIVTRGGRCLIPVFALGRAQELLLILDEFWSQHPELQDIPIYYASSLAKKCMAVYQTYVNAMNDRIRRQIAVNNPFVFKHISNLKSIDHFEDVGPCVVMASPGMMQSGLSRELFESWCGDSKNGVIIAGYCVEGTLAKQILSEPTEVTSMSGHKMPLKMTVDYISFSAHTDYQQTSEFIRALKPPNIVLVHGEQNEMSRLKAAIEREYEGEDVKMDVFNPANGHAVSLKFRGEQLAKVMGSLAVEKPVPGQKISGILVKRNFNYHLMAPADLGKYTELVQSTVQQKASLSYQGTFRALHFFISKVLTVKVVELGRVLNIMDRITLTMDDKMVLLEWSSSPDNDTLADAVVTCVIRAQSSHAEVPKGVAEYKVDKMKLSDLMLKMLRDMFGEESVSNVVKGERMTLTVSGKRVDICLKELRVSCPEDKTLETIVGNSVMRMYDTLMPCK
ncbi:cleavage and polyadenylation specificity factor 73-like isoform X2 [Varroa jacobsoni]|nr:cleavage and polyadenylation specificity factor 73-like isoform X2 [Varroa destructor]XP_022661756.1 cleavage and polyadenylation specificity factor 73-like isoform X2 [Varroa destructor]XP_022661757.1 cleavage and polyadenylation specificity factor 73-like isoform X2 [Varroa destructor]XP_022690963.1 cleavage and polyadenylation specificity factor 73-like isoform X2 [Varroa jacobsoni]